MKGTKSVALVTQPGEFFKEEISRAIRKYKVSIDPNTEFYLVDLLTRFMISENFFTVDEKGAKRTETLAFLLGDALQAEDHEKKKEDLRRLGDISLYTAGFFGDSLQRKTVDVDYYIGMGKNAYSNLSKISLDSYFRTVFTQLSEGFTKFVDVLGEVSSSTLLTDTKSILRSYDLWLKTGSERAESQLKEAGIIPNKRIKTSVQ